MHSSVVAAMADLSIRGLVSTQVGDGATQVGDGDSWRLATPVPLCVDGQYYVAGLQVDRYEHLRRRAVGVGAVTSTGVLHALWQLPYAVPTPKVSRRDRQRDAGGFPRARRRCGG